jgi:malyl-CoA/(S)-citramalyl-CoA lyase
MRSPKHFFEPMAVGAPAPLRAIPVTPSRMIHFFDPSNPRMAEKVPSIAAKVDVILGNLEDAIPIDRKEAAREGLVTIGQATDFGSTQLWTRVNSLDSPWFLDDVVRLVESIETSWTSSSCQRSRGPGIFIMWTDSSDNSKRAPSCNAPF